jgi:hypothetical protein
MIHTADLAASAHSGLHYSFFGNSKTTTDVQPGRGSDLPLLRWR